MRWQAAAARSLCSFYGARRIPSSRDYVMRTRMEQATRRQLALDCEGDHAMVVRFWMTAKHILGRAALCEELFEPLARIWEMSASAELHWSAWEQQLAALAVLPREVSRRSGRAPDIISALRGRIPDTTHEARLRAALRCVPTAVRGEAASEANAALSIVMEGALTCDAPSLRNELLDRFRGLASAHGVGLENFVQVPLLRRLGAPEAPTSSCGEEEGVRLGDGPSQLSAPFSCQLAAARLAAQGDTRGSKHGCVLVEDGGALLGAGFNHAVPCGGTKGYVVHAEAHAVADAIRRRGECAAFAAFPRATAWVVELIGTVGYDDAHPCPKCEGMLRAVGVRDVYHTSGVGRLVRRALGPPLTHLLAERSVCAPLAVILREEFGGVPCERLGDRVRRSLPRDVRATTAFY